MTINIPAVGPDERPGDVRTKEDELFAENLQLILRNAEYILSIPEYFFCTFGDAWLSLAYIGGGMIPLGVLLLLWQEGKLKSECPDCKGTLYIYGMGGSPLSGSHSWWGACVNCGKKTKGKSDYFPDLWVPLLDAFSRYPNEEIVKKGSRPRFSWSKGLIGEYTPDTIINAKIAASSIDSIVNDIKER